MNRPYPYFQEELPNATATFVLGLLSLLSVFVCCCVPVPFILAVIALVMGYDDKNRYRLQPGRYTPASYSNLKAGIACAIVGIVLYVIVGFVVIVLSVIDGMVKSGALRSLGNV